MIRLYFCLYLFHINLSEVDNDKLNTNTTDLTLNIQGLLTGIDDVKSNEPSSEYGLFISRP